MPGGVKPWPQAVALPCAGACSGDAGEDAGEVALIGKAAFERYLRQRQFGVAQKLLGLFHAVFQQPAVRGFARALLEGAGEVADRQSAFAGDEGQGDFAAKMGAHEFLGAALLPGRQPATEQKKRKKEKLKNVSMYDTGRR